MKITGRISQVLPTQSGVSKTGKEWRRQECILVYDEQNPSYPKSIVFSVMNERIENFNIQADQVYELDVDFETREYNGRYFMSASAWKCTLQVGAPQPQVQAQVQPQQMPQAQVSPHAPIMPQPQQQVAPQNGDDLPF